MTPDYERQRRKFLRHRKAKAKPVAIVCTNRGKHKRVHLAPVVVFLEEGVVELAEVPLLRRSGSGRVLHADDLPVNVRVPRTGERTTTALNAAAAWEFSCPKCHQVPRVSKTLIITAGLRGEKQFDVSYHG